jgi:hypothetical protein
LGKFSRIFKPIIVVRLYGGLGNQLFTYTAARRLAYVNNSPLYIDAFSGFFRDKIYKRRYKLDSFRIKGKKHVLGIVIGLIKFLLGKHIENKSLEYSFYHRRLIMPEQISYDHRLLDFKIYQSVIFEGHWQSEKYFEDIESVIRNELRFKSTIEKYIDQLHKSIDLSFSIAIHVRHFRRLNDLAKSNIDDYYYLKAIEYFRNKIENPIFFLFSDYPILAYNRLFKHSDNVIVVSDSFSFKDEVYELCFMSRFKYFIISNSTYSWWGAWLSEYKDKIVVAPKTKIDSGETAWGFDGLIPDGWIKI